MGVTALPGVSASGQSPLTNDQANGVIQGTLSGVGPSKAFAFYGPLNLEIWTEYTTSLAVTNGSSSATVGAAGAIVAGAAIRSTAVPPGTTAGGISGTTVTLALPTYTFWGISVSGQNTVSGIYDTTWLQGAAMTGLGFAGVNVTGIPTPSVSPVAVPVPGVRTGTVQLASNATVGPQNQNPTPFDFALNNAALATVTDNNAVFTGAGIGLAGQVQLERSFDGGQTWIVCNIGSAGALAQFSTASPVSVAFGEPERAVLYRLNVTSLTPVAGNTLKYRLSATGQAATTLAVPTI